MMRYGRWSLLLVWVGYFWLLNPVPGFAAPGLVATSAQLEFAPQRQKWLLSGDFEVQIGDSLRDAIDRGIAVYFLVELKVVQPRWYWFDRKVLEKRQQVRLMYNALSRTYLISRGQERVAAHTLAEALKEVGVVHAWPVAEQHDLEPEEDYRARLQMTFDLASLPKPIQVSALTDGQWSPAATALTWDFSMNAQGQVIQHQGERLRLD